MPPDDPVSPTECRTLKDLATLAGCSVNTVSRALRGDPRLSEGTRTRVQDLAKRHGYRPNPLVSAFMAHRRQAPARQVIAVVTKFGYPFFSRRDVVYCNEILAGMEAKADELGFQLEEFPTLGPDALSGKRLTQILRARGIRGVIFLASGDFDDDFPELEWAHFAIVAQGFHSKSRRMHRVAPDHLQGLEVCLEHAAARGCRRIGLALTGSLDPRLRYAVSGRFFAWQAMQPEHLRIPLMPTEGEIPLQGDFDAWMLEHQPDCIIGERAFLPEWIDQVNPRLDHPAICLLFNRREEATVPGVDSQLPLVGKTVISVLARELYLNHYGLPEAQEVILVNGAWRESGGPASVTDVAITDAGKATSGRP